MDRRLMGLAVSCLHDSHMVLLRQLFCDETLSDDLQQSAGRRRDWKSTVGLVDDGYLNFDTRTR